MTRITSALVALSALLASPSLAQIIPTGTPAADILLLQALADQRVFLTCTALESAQHQSVLDFWQADTAAALAILTEKGVPPEAIAAFTAAARPESLMLPPDTPFADLRDFCAAQEDWALRWSGRNFTELARSLPKALP